MQKYKLTVAIVNWNTQELLSACLGNFYKYAPKNMESEVIVVDNGSIDNSVQFVREKFPKVKLILNEDNLGFGAANNKAINMAQGEYILFLNTDVVLTENAALKLIEFMDTHPNAGLCSPQLLSPDRRKQETYVTFPNIMTELFGRISTKECNTACRVSAVRGACMLARKDAITNIGCFNEKYFLFLEETDLCLRLNKNEYEVWCVPEVEVYHTGGGSAKEKKADARIEYWKSRYLFFAKNHSLVYYHLFGTGMCIKLALDWLVNGLAVILTLFLNKKFKSRAGIYSTMILWHILMRPSDWGIGSDNIVKVDGWLVRNGFQTWFEINKDSILKGKGTTKLVKENSSRKLFIYNDEVYVKFYKNKSFLAQRNALREWRLINRIRQFDISTVTPIAFGNGYLITKKINEVQSLHEFIEKNVKNISFETRVGLIKSFAKFLKKIHAKGVYHGDLHAGNILIAKEGNGYKYYITDLHRAKLKPRLSRSDIVNNLVEFNKFFSLYLLSSERMLFFKHYIPGTLLAKYYKKYAAIIAKKTAHTCYKLWRKRDKLYLKKNKYGIRGTYSGIKYILNPIYRDLNIAEIFKCVKYSAARPQSILLREELDAPSSSEQAPRYSCAVIENKQGNVIKDSRSSFVSKIDTKNIGSVVLKIYRQKKIVNYIKDIFRKSRGFKAWCGAWALITRRIETPLPVIAGELRIFGIVKYSFIVTKYVADSSNLTLTARNNAGLLTPYFVNKLSLYIKTLHDRGIFPLDMKGSNIIVRNDPGMLSSRGLTAGSSFLLIDLDHVKIKKKVTLNQRLYNILQIRKSAKLLLTQALPVKRILIIKPSSLGDIIQSLPVACMLRAEFTSANIWWLANRDYADFLKLSACIDKVIVFERRKWGKIKNILKTIMELATFISNVRQKHFDIVIDLQGLFRSGLITRLSGASVRIGFGDARDFVYIFYNNSVYLDKNIVHAQKRYFKLAEYITKETKDISSISIPKPVKEWADKIWGEEKIKIAINPGGRWNTKRWPADRYAQLINNLSKKYKAKIILIGGKNDGIVISDILKNTSLAAIDISGKTTLIELAALINKANILITNDSGPMHMADYLGIPVVALFGPTDPKKTGPLGKMSKILKADVSCSPCFKRQCGKTICMESIDVSTVFDAVEDVLKKSESMI